MEVVRLMVDIIIFAGIIFLIIIIFLLLTAKQKFEEG